MQKQLIEQSSKESGVQALDPVAAAPLYCSQRRPAVSQGILWKSNRTITEKRSH